MPPLCYARTLLPQIWKIRELKNSLNTMGNFDNLRENSGIFIFGSVNFFKLLNKNNQGYLK